jgi:ferrous iron transport protein A
MFSRKRVDASLGPDSRDGFSLANLPVGQTARIREIRGEDAIAGRLLEMGLTPGSITRVLGAAFSGDPIEIEIRNYRLTLRLAEARRVVLESVSGSQP